jgi:hypothetical protein
VRKQPEVSEVHIASIFMAEVYAKQKQTKSFPPASAVSLLGLLFDSEVGGDMYLRNFRLYSS